MDSKSIEAAIQKLRTEIANNTLLVELHQKSIQKLDQKRKDLTAEIEAHLEKEKVAFSEVLSAEYAIKVLQDL